MTRELRYLNWVTVAVIAGAIFAAAMDFIPINLETLENADLLTLLLTVIFVALVIERAVEVYANNRFDPERARIRLPLSVIESSLSFKERLLEAELARPEPDEKEVADLRKRIRESQDKLMAVTEKIEPELAEVRRKKAAYAAMLATVLSSGQRSSVSACWASSCRPPQRVPRSYLARTPFRWTRCCSSTLC